VTATVIRKLTGVSSAQVVNRMVHRAGLRADALSTWEVVCGATVESAA